MTAGTPLGKQTRCRLAALLLILAACVLAACSALETTAANTPVQAPISTATVPVLSTAPLVRADRPVRFRQLSISEGLSESVVRDVLQDRDGFLWLATDDGLNRFDGYNFIIYKNDPENPASLSHNQVYRLLEDSQGRLWVGTFSGGLNRFDREMGKFTRYRYEAKRPDSLAGSRVNAILEDRAGNIWVATHGGLNRYDPEQDNFLRYQNQAEDPASLISNTVLALAEDPAGGLWIGTNKGLDYFDPQTGIFTHYQKSENDPTSLSYNTVFSLRMDRQGRLWVGTIGGKLDRLDTKSGGFVHYMVPDSTTGWMQVTSIIEDSAGVLWVGMMEDGLCRLLPGDKNLTCFRPNPADPDSLRVNDILSLYVDRSGILWVGTYGAGANLLDPGYKPFANLRSDPRNPNSLGGSMVFAILQDQHGDLWVGTHGAGLDRVSGSTGQVTHFRHDDSNPGSIASDEIHTIYKDSRGALWIGTDAGIDILEPGAQHFKNIHTVSGDTTSLADNQVVGIGEDPQGRLWVASSSALNRFDREAGTFTRYQNDPQNPDSLTASSLTTMLIESSGLIWLGTMSKGLERFDPSTSRVGHFPNNPDDPTALSDGYVLSLREDHVGALWVGTAAGLNRLDRASGTFQHFRTKDGLPNDFIYAILEDNQQRLWVSTNKGLSRYDPRTDTYKNFDVGDGLQSNEFNMGAGWKGSNGELFFGGIEGVTAFSPEQVRDNPYLPPVVLTSLAQHGETMINSLEHTREITVRWPDNYFDFEFAALNYLRPENNQYAYMLEGFDRDWNEIGSKRSGRYTNLPGGTFTLRLKGSNNDGLWNETGTSIMVRVIPPFWATWWFRAGSILLLAGMVFGAVRVRVRSVETRNQELERMVRARTSEIAQLYEQTKELAIVQERNRLARDLHDSAKQKAFAALAQLGAANGLLRANPSGAQDPLSEAETLVYEVIEDLTFLIQEMYPAALKEKGLATVLREYIYEWEGRSEILVHFEMEQERRLAIQIEQALYRIVQEALANVARHSKASQVEVLVRYAPENVSIHIIDNGQGFDIAQRRAGVGLRSMQERITLIGGELNIESAPGKGTRITVCAPARLPETR